MKKIRLITVAAVLSIMLCGCGMGETTTQIATVFSENTEIKTEAEKKETPTTELSTVSKTVNYKVYQLDNLRYSVPDNWSGDGQLNEDQIAYFYPEHGMLMVQKQQMSYGTIENADNRNAILEGMNSGLENGTLAEEEVLKIDGYPAFITSGEGDLNEKHIYLRMIDVQVEHNVYVFGIVSYEGYFDAYTTDTNEIFASIHISGTPVIEDTTEKETEEKSEEKIEAESTASLGEQNALKSALSYLKFTAFSHDGLIEQLEYEGYSKEEAGYAADHCGADWKEQALKSAKDYLNYTAFSYKGLIEQLEYEKFSNEEATYAADNCGADWMEQAAKTAQSYMDYSSFSKSGLIEQLEYEGYTKEQAKYGAEAVGY